MKVARVLYPVKVLGPGMRIGLWLSGCPRRCEGCSNPELWETESYQEVAVADLLNQLEKIIRTRSVDGVTITGGEPLFQPKELAKLLMGLKDLTTDILVYTGYTLAELKSSAEPAVGECLEQIGVVIDGPYVKNLNRDCLLRGSENQRIIVLNQALKAKYDAYLVTAHNEVQNFTVGASTISVGIHKPDFERDLKKSLSSRGLREIDNVR